MSNYFCHITPYQYHTNFEQHMYEYPFALYPSDTQPSGHINMSRIQPLDEKRRDNGLRIGEMEKDFWLINGTPIGVPLESLLLDDLKNKHPIIKINDILSDYFGKCSKPTKTLRKTRKLAECPICYIDTYGYKFKSCKYHKFCKKCIGEWTKDKYTVSCPVCRR